MKKISNLPSRQAGKEHSTPNIEEEKDGLDVDAVMGDKCQAGWIADTKNTISGLERMKIFPKFPPKL